MADTKPCPREAELQSLLDGTLAGEAQAALADHLDTCTVCRDQLERLASQAAEFVEENALLDGKTHGSDALKQVMEKLKSDTAGWPKTRPEANARPLNLDFLSPSPNRRHLGRLGDYEILEVIGRGGMGTVLKARDPKLERLVAVKVLNGELASSGPARARFLREARSAAAVTHEHVVTIHAVDDSAEVPFLVMEYIVGVSLEDRIQRSGHLKVEEILRIGMQIASGLAAAHTQGLVHRDIKPSNILLENGVERVKITDFGLARVVHEAQVTQSNLIAGTPQYMSPEQARGEPVDHRSDLFSLGCVLYAMCVGRSPFRAETLTGAIHRVCEDQPRPIKELNPDIPDWLVVVVDRLLAKDRDERFQTAREVAELLGQYMAHVQQPSRIALPAGRGLKVARSHRAWPAWSKLVAAVAGIATIAALLMVPKWGDRGGGGATDSDPSTPLPRYTELSIQEWANRLLTDGTDGPQNHLGELDRQLTVDGVPFRTGPRYMQLAGHKVPGCPPEIRGIEVNRLAAKVHILHGASWTDGMPGLHVATYTFHYDDGSAEPFKIITGRHVREWWHRVGWRNLATRATRAWSGNNTVAIANNAEIQVFSCTWENPHPDKRIISFDFERGPTERPAPFLLAVTLDDDHTPLPPEAGLLVASIGSWAGSSQFSFEVEGTGSAPMQGGGWHEWLLPPGRHRVKLRGGEMVFRDGVVNITPGCVFFLDIQSPQVLFPLPGTQPEPAAALVAQGGITDAAITRDGDRLVCVAGNGTVAIWRRQDKAWTKGSELPLIPGPAAMALSPTDGIVAVGCKDGSISLWNIQTCGLQAALDTHKSRVASVAFSPDGRLLAVGYGDGTVNVWNVDTQAKSVTFRAFSESVTDVVFSPDGTLLATGGSCENSVKLWDVSTWKIQRELSGHTDSVAAIRFAPNGELLASAGRDGAVMVWNMETGKSLHRFLRPQALLSVAFDPAGRKVAAGGLFQTVSVWDVESGKILHDFQAQWNTVKSLLFDSEGDTLITAGGGNYVRMWDLADLPDAPGVDTPRVEPMAIIDVNHDWSMCAAFSSPESNLIAATGGKTQGVCVYDLNGFTRIARLPVIKTDHDWMMRQSIAFGPDERELTTCVSTNGPPRITIWQPEMGILRDEFQPGTIAAGQDISLAKMAVSPDGASLAVASSSERRISLVNATTHKVQWSVTTQHGSPFCVAFAPDGKMLAAGTDGGALMLLDVKTGDLVHDSPQRSTSVVNALAFSREGVLAIARRDGLVSLMSLDSLEESHLPSEHEEELFSASFSPDGNLLVTAGGADLFTAEPWTRKGEICLWDVDSRKLITKFDAHYGSVMCAVFSPDGKRLATTGRDGKLNLWDVDELLQNGQ